MSRTMLIKHMGELLDEVLRDSNEYKAYNLGIAVGYFYLYSYIKTGDGQEWADKVINDLISEMQDPYVKKTLKKIIDLENKQPETKAEMIAEKMYKSEKIIL